MLYTVANTPFVQRLKATRLCTMQANKKYRRKRVQRTEWYVLPSVYSFHYLADYVMLFSSRWERLLLILCVARLTEYFARFQPSIHLGRGWKYWLLPHCQPFRCLFTQHLNGTLNNNVSRSTQASMTLETVNCGPTV